MKDPDRWKKDLYIRAYELGDKEGHKVIRRRANSNDGDLIVLLLDYLPERYQDDLDELLEIGTAGELYELVKNFIDGMEDGTRSELSRWLTKFRREL